MVFEINRNKSFLQFLENKLCEALIDKAKKNQYIINCLNLNSEKIP